MYNSDDNLPQSSSSASRPAYQAQKSAPNFFKKDTFEDFEFAQSKKKKKSAKQNNGNKDYKTENMYFWETDEEEGETFEKLDLSKKYVLYFFFLKLNFKFCFCD